MANRLTDIREIGSRIDNKRIEIEKDQESLDIHHASPMMGDIMALREKYALSMRAERYVTDEGGFSENDKKFMNEK